MLFRLADAAGLTNIAIREASFQELAAEASEGQHDLDIIQLHGILTWVSADAHRAIVEIARKRLKPGGLLYVSYNCMPGWAAMAPIQRLMREHAKRNNGSSLEKSAKAIEAVKALATSNGRYFPNNPTVLPRIEKLGSMQPSYIAHEYLNENWFIFHFADVAEMMGEAKLTYLASASIAENIDVIAVPAEMRSVVENATDPVWKETLKDFACNKQFRRDIFARGFSSLNNLETLNLLNSLRFTLAMPRSSITLKLPSPLGDIEAKPEIYNVIADILAERVVPFDELSTAPALQSVGLPGTLQSLALMINAGQVFPVFGEANTDFGPAQRLNRALANYADMGRIYHFVAAPAVRSALPATTVDLMSVTAVYAGHENDPSAIIAHVLNTLNRHGTRPTREGKPVEDLEEVRKIIAEEVNKFLAEKLPLWRRLGVL